MWRIIDLNMWPTAEKIDSHTDEEAAIKANSHERWLGNDRAGKYAKRGAVMHAYPAQDLANVSQERDLAIRVIRHHVPTLDQIETMKLDKT